MASPQQATAVAAAAVAESQAAQQQQSQGQQSAHPAHLKLETLDQGASSSAPTSSATVATAPTQNASASSSSPTGQNQMCKWSNPMCREIFSSPEDLYTHLTEVHVGRKSNNNLNLTCRWEQCNTTVIKRDHITSHLRVHVALKPHTCPKCNKSFKRPQDLKKHIKTHADDSGAQGQGHGAATAYGPMTGQGNGAGTFYTSPMPGNGMGFPFQQQTGGYHANYTQGNASMHTGFAGGNYWSPPAGHTGPQATTFSLQGLLGAHRANDFQTNDYSSWRHHLDGAFEPMHQQPYTMHGGHGGVAVAQPYQNPHELAASLRSKGDLSQVHAMLKEMHQAALSHQQPQTQVMSAPGVIDRASGSPDMHSPATSAMHYSSNRSTTSPTPSLTPGSSVHSYAHSPAHEYVLPSTQAPAVSYPNLTGISAGPVHTGLGAQYDHDNFRRHAERLGAGQTRRDAPRSEGSSSSDSDSTLDPQLRNTANTADASRDEASSRENSATPTATTPRAETISESERMSQSINMIQSWMTAIQERLTKGEFDDEEEEACDEEARDDDGDHEMTDATEEESKAIKTDPEPVSTNPTYPPLPMSDY